MPAPTLKADVIRHAANGEARGQTRNIPAEGAVAIEINGIGYAVMMATPQDLADFATGFCLSERLIDTAADVLDIDVAEVPSGHLLRVTVAAHCQERLAGRIRHRVSDASCGLCGIENLEQALRPLPPLKQPAQPSRAAIFRALTMLDTMQPLNQATGGCHAAAFVQSDGQVVLVREDVGRHNAFDKLIGAMATGGTEWKGGFALLTSRCSYELVEKAALAQAPALVTVSVATSLALEAARQAGLPLVMLARPDAYLAAMAETPASA